MKYSISIHAYAIFMEVIYDKLEFRQFPKQPAPKTAGGPGAQEGAGSHRGWRRGWSGMGTNALEVGVFVV